MDFLDTTFIEESFFNLLGFHLSGPAGLLFGLTLFCLFIILIRKERTSGKKKSETSDFEDIGQPIEAKINLSRSYIEMGQFGDASKYLQEALIICLLSNSILTIIFAIISSGNVSNVANVFFMRASSFCILLYLYLIIHNY